MVVLFGILALGVAAAMGFVWRLQYLRLLRESESQFRSLFDNAMVGVAMHEIVLDEHGKPVDYIVVRANPAFGEQTGLRVADVLGKRVSEAIPDIRDVPFIEIYGKVALTGEPTTFEQFSESLQRHCHVSVYPLGQGRFATVFQDITQRKRAEEEVLLKNVLLAAQQEVSIDGILAVDGDEQVILLNRRFAEMWSISPELLAAKADAVVLRSVQDQVADPGAFLEKVRFLYNHRHETSRDEIALADGRIFDRYSAPMFGPGERYYGRVWYFRDITEHRRAEIALRQSEALYRSLVENIDIGIVLVDSSHNIVTVNAAQARMCGKDASEFAGKKCFRVLEEREAVCPFCPGAKALAEGQPGEVEMVRTRDDGSQTVVRIRAFPMFGQDGKPTGFIEMVEDITQFKNAQENLRQAKEAAETANRVKSEFLANMSHEIRTPMTAILGYAKFLLTEDGLETAPKHRVDAFEAIFRNGEHLLDLINGILDLSKIEAGKLQIEQTRCSPRQVVAEVLSLMRVRAAEKPLELVSQFLGPMPETIDTDALRLRQVLINLVGNAIKFSDRGEVRILVRFLRDERRPSMQFDVADTGIGMTAEQIQRLFQPFSQIDSSASRKYGGTGLGLAISKRLIEALGGSITVRSVPGQGSTFRFTIAAPLSAGAVLSSDDSTTADGAAPETAVAALKQSKWRGRVLLAEDAPDLQRLMILLLESTGVEVAAVENGQLAVERARVAREEARPFDVILMDMQMPVMDGYAAARELRRKGYEGTIFALTAHAMLEDRQKCLDAGCDDYLSKPVDIDQLLAKCAQFAAAASTKKVAMQPNDGPAPPSGGEESLRSEYADHPVISGILGEFVDGLGPRVKAMETAFREGRSEELRQIAHQLKGSAGSYGYRSLSDAAKTLEDMAQGGLLGSAEAAVERINGLTRAVANGWNAPQGNAPLVLETPNLS